MHIGKRPERRLNAHGGAGCPRRGARKLPPTPPLINLCPYPTSGQTRAPAPGSCPCALRGGGPAPLACTQRAPKRGVAGCRGGLRSWRGASTTRSRRSASAPRPSAPRTADGPEYTTLTDPRHALRPVARPWCVSRDRQPPARAGAEAAGRWIGWARGPRAAGPGCEACAGDGPGWGRGGAAREGADVGKGGREQEA